MTQASNDQTDRHPLLTARPAHAGYAAGETGRMLLATDWAATPLGPMDGGRTP